LADTSNGNAARGIGGHRALLLTSNQNCKDSAPGLPPSARCFVRSVGVAILMIMICSIGLWLKGQEHITPLSFLAYMGFVVALGFGAQLLTLWLDPWWIRRHVERQGGTVIEIIRRSGGLAWGYFRYYDARYITRSGKTVTATCTIGRYGIRWVRHNPPRRLPEEDNIFLPGKKL